MSYNGIGLKSAKGSSTSGHIQRSLANNDESKQRQLKNYTARRNLISKPNNGALKAKVATQETMLKHISKRQIEVSVSELRDELEDKDLEEEVIEQRCSELRTKLLQEQETEQRISKVYKPRSQRQNSVTEGSNGRDITEEQEPKE